MTEALASHLNALSCEAALAELGRCCGSTWWCEQIVADRPFHNVRSLLSAIDRAFDQMPREAWLEAFGSHPRIGDLESLKLRFAGNREWSTGEQSGVADADMEVLTQLRDGNKAYFERFGFTFIVCATGKSAGEMLAILRRRLDNPPDAELAEAAGEQRKITRLRLEKLAASLPDS